jgi:hypothetical protein
MRHKLTLEQQIRGLQKGIASSRTPKQFKPSMRKRLAKLRGKK